MPIIQPLLLLIQLHSPCLHPMQVLNAQRPSGRFCLFLFQSAQNVLKIVQRLVSKAAVCLQVGRLGLLQIRLLAVEVGQPLLQLVQSLVNIFDLVSGLFLFDLKIGGN